LSRNLKRTIINVFLVTSTAKEPFVGWVDSIYGPMASVMAMTLGLQRYQLGNGNVETNMVPVDMTANALIASAWDVFSQQRYDRIHILTFANNIVM